MKPVITTILIVSTVASASAVAPDHPAIQANQAVQERWLFTHPTWLRWWILPNLEAYPDVPRVITGVFCVFIETPSGANSVLGRAELEARTRALGLDFAYGRRHSHKKGEVKVVPTDPAWHKATVRDFLTARTDTWMIDSEPYYFGARRYNIAAESPAVFAATHPWRQLGPGRLFIYPAGPEYVQFHAIAAHARAGGTNVFALDPSTYGLARRKDVVDFLQTRTADHATRAYGDGVAYVPGFFLEYALDDTVMRHVAQTYGRCWFFGRTSRNHYDDLPRFGRPDWKWFQKLTAPPEAAQD